jgi:hypothetical protein
MIMPVTQKLSISLLIIIILTPILFSCKDIGLQPPAESFKSQSDSLVIVKGFAANLFLSGGETPYFIKTQPDSFIATAILDKSSITIQGIDTGKTFIIVSDSKLPVPDTLKVKINVIATPPSTNISYSNQVQPIFNSQCVGCHGAEGGLNLSASVSRNNLVNVSAQGNCNTLKRVLPFDAANSVLYRKVAGSTCGARMPQGDNLTQTDIDLIKNWIDQGAINN